MLPPRRGLKTELLCTEHPTTQKHSCRALSSYDDAQLRAIDRDHVLNWTEYSYYPGKVFFFFKLEKKTWMMCQRINV